MKKYTFSIFFIFAMNQVFGQQIPQYSQYLQNPFVLNPATFGASKYTQVSVSTRQQWTGIEGTPSTYLATFSAPIEHGQSYFHGVGGYFVSDHTGGISRTGVYGGYSIHVPVGENSHFSAGVSLGYLRFSLGQARLSSASDPSDPALFAQPANGIVDGSFGLLFKSRDFFFGLAVNQALPAEVNLYNPNLLQKHYNIMAGYLLAIDHDKKVALMPSVMYRKGATSYTDVNLTVRFEDKAWLGTSYRLKYGWIFTAGADLGGLILSYSYDAATSLIGLPNNGSHELTLGWRTFKESKNRWKDRNRLPAMFH